MQADKPNLNTPDNRLAIVMIAAIFLMIIIAIIGGVLSLFISPSNTDEPVTQATPVPSSETSVTTNELNTNVEITPIDSSSEGFPQINNQGIYTNTQLGYSFTVPQNYKVKDFNNGVQLVIYRSDISAQEAKIASQLGQQITIIPTETTNTWKQLPKTQRNEKLIDAVSTINSNEVYQLMIINYGDNNSSTAKETSTYVSQVFIPDSNQEEAIEISTGISGIVNNQIESRELSEEEKISRIQDNLRAYQNILKSFRFIQ